MGLAGVPGGMARCVEGFALAAACWTGPIDVSVISQGLTLHGEAWAAVKTQ